MQCIKKSMASVPPTSVYTWDSMRQIDAVCHDMDSKLIQGPVKQITEKEMSRDRTKVTLGYIDVGNTKLKER